MPQSIIPYLSYEDVPAALDFLAKAFGFEERLRFADADGTVNHAEMRLGDGIVMMGDPGPDYRSPKRTETQSQHLVVVYVDDVDAHFERARAAGAELENEPQDEPYGDRRYSALDLEGHRWSFHQHVRDVPAEEWGAVGA